VKKSVFKQNNDDDDELQLNKDSNTKHSLKQTQEETQQTRLLYTNIMN